MALRASHIMRTHLSFCSEVTPLRKLAEIMTADPLGAVLVRHGEHSVGIVTANDLLRSIARGVDFETGKAADIMSEPLVTCRCDDRLEEVLHRFEEAGCSRMVIVREGKAVGIIRRIVAEQFLSQARLHEFSNETRRLPFRRGSGSATS